MEIGGGRMKSILPNFHIQGPTELYQSCALDVAEKQGPLTLEAIGENLNITRERVRQIEKMVLEKLGVSAEVLREFMQNEVEGSIEFLTTNRLLR